MYRFIVNPAAMGGQCRSEWKKIAKELESLGVVFETFCTEKPGHAGELCRELCSLPDTELIGLVGGDGTLNEMAEGYDCRKAVPVFYIPCGSGNDFARGIAHPINRENAAYFLKNLNKLTPKPVDIGHLSLPERKVKRFLVSSGAGYDAAVCYDLNHSKLKKKLNKLHLGGLSYVFLGIKNMFGCPLSDGILSLNNGEKVILLSHLAFISAHNLPYEGGGFCFAPKAECGDGELDLCVVTAKTHLGFILKLAASVNKGAHIKKKGVYALRCRQAELQLKTPLHVHADGEVFGQFYSLSFSTDSDKLMLYR